MMRFERQKVLVISPHQDDMEIGCGGLVQKYLEAGSEVFVVHGTFVGIEATYKKYDKVAGTYAEYTGADRLEETHDAMVALDPARQIELLAPMFSSDLHHKLDTVPLSARVAALEKAMALVKPTVLLVTAVSYDQDHEALNRAVMAVMRPHFYNGAVLEYEVGNELGFSPNVYVSLTVTQLDRKLKAFAAYKTQNSGSLHMVSTEGIRMKAEHRGKQCYVPQAEAFSLLRGVCL